MPPRSTRLTFAEFAREVLEQRQPLLYAVAVCAAAIKAGDTYQGGVPVPEALLVGVVDGLGIFVAMCTVVWFTLKIRGL
jgi:hypothetical protein